MFGRARQGWGGVGYLYAELWRIASGCRRMLVAACSLLVLAQLILLLVPYVASRAINALQLNGAAGLHDAARWLFTVLLLAIASWTVHGPARLLERNVALQVRRKLSTALLEHLCALPLSWHEAHHSGETAHRVQQSTHALVSFAQSQFIYLNSLVRLVGPLAALWCIDPVIGLACSLGFALITLSVLRFDRAMIRLAREENDAERRYAATLVDALGNAGTVLALRQPRGVVALLQQRLISIFKPLKRSIVINELKWFTVDLSTRALSASLVALFVWRIARLQQTGSAQAALLLGSIYMVWEYANQASEVIGSIAQHFQSYARQHADYASADLIRAAPATKAPMRAAVAAPTDHWSCLHIHELTFRHGTQRASGPTLDRVALTLERGKRYALIGDSGSGKSTLLRILAGLYESERVVMRCDSGPLMASPAAVSHRLRTTATLVPQDAEVFAGSIAENLQLCARADGEPVSRDFAHALRVAGADFIDASPEGLQTEVAERAANWSGGQRSRIALARGVLAASGSSLVLLDEPTANLDPATESRIYDNLFHEFRHACLLSSVHRLHLLERFDEILLMSSGRLIAQGPLPALIIGCPEFRVLSALLSQRGGELTGKDAAAAAAAA